MVRRPAPELDDELLDKEKSGLLERRSRVDNALAVAIVLSVALLALLILTREKENWWAVLLLGIVFLATEYFALPMRFGGKVSLALVPVTMAMMISGALGGALVCLFGIPVYILERGEAGMKRVAFNTCQLFFAAGTAAWIFHHVGGGLLDAGLENGGKLVLPWILAVLVFYLLNTVLVTPVLAPESERMPVFWRKSFLPEAPGYLLYGGIGFLAAIVYLRLEFPAVVLLLAPIIAIRIVYTRYDTMRDVCDETTLCVMEAVEGGSVYTDGHSVGVADIAVAVAERMNFQEEDIHYLKQAALLHDIGKLGLDRSLVEKEGPLTPEEYEQIKQHPLIGGNIASREPSFAVVAPSITHHHEMVDGSGYVDGLAGDTIPIGARIISVADAYDAMQRPTGFRGPLAPYQAAAEIIRAKGIQFDPEVVDAFIAVVTERGIWKGSLEDEVRMPEIAGAKAPEKEEKAEEGEPSDQPTLEEAFSTEADKKRADSVTPAEGIDFEDVKGSIEKDISEWKSTDVQRRRRRERSDERSGRAGSGKKKPEEKE